MAELHATSKSVSNVAGDGQVVSYNAPQAQSQIDMERHIASVTNPAEFLKFINNLAKERDELARERDELRIENQLLNCTLALMEPTFTYFPKLPAEIRVMIWKLVLPGPRIVYVKRALFNEEEVLEDDYDGRKPPRSSCPIPVLLHVNSEARQIALRVYSLSFGTKILLKSAEIHYPGQVYCNFDEDTIIFPVRDIWGWTKGLIDTKERFEHTKRFEDYEAQFEDNERLEDNELLQIKNVGINCLNNYSAQKLVEDLKPFFLSKCAPKEVFFSYGVDYSDTKSGNWEIQIHDAETKVVRELSTLEYLGDEDAVRYQTLEAMDLKVMLAKKQIRKIKKSKDGNDGDLNSVLDISTLDIPLISVADIFRPRRAPRYC